MLPRTFKMNSQNMLPTILNSEWLYVFPVNEIKRGDIIIFNVPKKNKGTIVSRVVAVPGDTLEIKDKVLYLNNKMIPYHSTNCELCDRISQHRDNSYKFEFFKTKIGNHQIIYQNDIGNIYLKTHKKITIPKRKYFILGDNRGFSWDSRFFGLLDKENISYEVNSIYFSLLTGRIGKKL